MADEQTLVEALRAATHAAHENLDHFMGANAALKTKENYEKFLQIQEVFHKIAEDAYRDPELNSKIPNLSQGSRYQKVIADMRALAVEPLELPEVPELTSQAARIGWLYCAEGSNLGAAFILKDAQSLGFDEEKGASHLAGHPDGRGRHWREFVKYYNELAGERDEAERAEIIKAADQAFTFYTNLARRALMG